MFLIILRWVLKYILFTGHQKHYHQRFMKFASLQYNDEAYMTPRDFVKCFLSPAATVPVHRTNLSSSDIKEILHKSSKVDFSYGFLRELGPNGVISYSDYLFLISVLTHPQSGLEIAFRMFDLDSDGSVDLDEFKKITKIIPKFYMGDHQCQNVSTNVDDTTLLHLFFGKSGKRKLHRDEFYKFISGLQSELLHYEFEQLNLNQGVMSPVDLGRSLLRYSNISADNAQKGLLKIQADRELMQKEVSFDDYKALFDFLFVLDDFTCAIRMFLISKHSISKDEFQRAAHAVTGMYLSPVVLDTIFTLFDIDGDGHLSVSEFIETIRARGLRGLNINDSVPSRVDSFKQCIRKFSYSQ
uniref:EF-hand domain-containing protein n=1 Tax=Trichobilharzia regenti TaxID=157069 RepID=A0AA85JXM5_TRIRE|nr:unnamed protein product [Trichobilharzia regenti]